MDKIWQLSFGSAFWIFQAHLPAVWKFDVDDCKATGQQ